MHFHYGASKINHQADTRTVLLLYGQFCCYFQSKVLQCTSGCVSPCHSLRRLRKQHYVRQLGGIHAGHPVIFGLLFLNLFLSQWILQLTLSIKYTIIWRWQNTDQNLKLISQSKLCQLKFNRISFLFDHIIFRNLAFLYHKVSLICVCVSLIHSTRITCLLKPYLQTKLPSWDNKIWIEVNLTQWVHWDWTEPAFVQCLRDFFLSNFSHSVGSQSRIQVSWSLKQATCVKLRPQTYSQIISAF